MFFREFRTGFKKRLPIVGSQFLPVAFVRELRLAVKKLRPPPTGHIQFLPVTFVRKLRLRGKKSYPIEIAQFFPFAFIRKLRTL